MTIITFIHCNYSAVMAKVRHFDTQFAHSSENKENELISRPLFRNIAKNEERKTPSIVLSHDSDSDTDSDGTINWKDYYGDDEQGLHYLMI